VALVTVGEAQLPQVGVPRGQLRLEIGADFSVANAAFFDGTQGALRGEWNGDLGSSIDPNLSGAETLIRTLTGNATYRLSAGRSTVRASAQTGTAVLSAGLGLTKRLSLFGTLPFVRARAQTHLSLDSTGANVGFNPADPNFGTVGGPAAATAFLNDFQTALNTLAAKIANGDYNADPPTLALANQTLTDGTALRGQLATLLTGPNSQFVPLATSTESLAILSLLHGVQGTLDVDLGVPGFTSEPGFAATPLTTADYRGILTDGSGPVGAIYRGDQTLQRPGDFEVGAVYTVIDAPRFRLAATGIVRLPTGLADRPDDFFDVGTGQGQTDIEGRLTADFVRGMVGARVSAGYNRQLAGTLERRTSAAPLAYASTLAEVSRDPGDEVTLGFEPFLRLAPGFALTLGVQHGSRGAEEYTLSGGGSAPGAAPAQSATLFGGGFTYSSFDGRPSRGTPVEARVAFREVVSATGGIVERTRTAWFQLRMFYTLW
jgi:hypothetical protein